MIHRGRGVVILFALCLSMSAPAQESKQHKKTGIWIPAGLTEQEIENGWIALFDDKSKFGWRAESKVDWSVQDGAIGAKGGEVGLLRTTSQFDNFILRLEFKAARGTNSGVFIRTSPRPKNPAGDCYEINIAPGDNPFPTGSIVARQKAATVDAAPDQWHAMEITAKGPDLTVKIGKKTVATYRDKKPLGRGYIGLQFNSGSILFRKIKLKPIQLDSIFNGKDLAGWKTYPDLKSKFSVEEQSMRVQNGSGQIETTQKYGDFIFQMRCRTNAAKLNSGVFFRCIPGQKMNGYESQIQNGYRDSRTKPEDCGTGGIFRRQNARFVNADDQKWFSKTIVAVGPHFAVWVNGLQVSDWTDKRKENENPRRGRRLKPGTIMIQGHDPTTDLLFQKIFASELDERRPKK